jgi:CRP-like cAMP-binding protein/RsiW-degrading membrane proteinase PrsW (M82 family)
VWLEAASHCFFKEQALMLFAALFVATIVPLLFFYTVWALDLYASGSFRTVAICFVWGLVSFGLAYGINTASLNFISTALFVTVTAPIIEEILKSLVLVYYIRRPDFTYFVDGAIYGFASGTAFSVFENYFYLYQEGGMLAVAIGRVLSTCLMHGTTSALVGISLGRFRFQRRAGRTLSLVGGLAVAMAFHMAFNRVVFAGSGWLLLATAAGIGFAGAGAVGLIMRQGLREEKAWIEEKLSMAVGVTDGESAAIQRLEDLQEVLEPLVQRFGPEKARQVEEILVKQAQLGIKRKALEKLTDQRLRHETQVQIERLRVEIDAARQNVGVYGMIYLRSIFPQEVSPLWGHLKVALEAPPSREPQVDLWGAVTQRLKKISAFREVPEETLGELLKLLKRHTIGQGEVIFHKGDPGDAMYVIESGRVQISLQDEAGREVVLRHYGPGQVFGEMSMLDWLPRSATATAVEPMTVMILPRNVFMNYLKEHPDIAIGMMRDLSGRLRYTSDYLEKVIDWSQKLARGEYGETLKDEGLTVTADTEGTISELVSAFFHMVRQVQEREARLRRRVEELEIVIDEAKKAKQVEEITESDYFQRLREQAEKIRKRAKGE